MNTETSIILELQAIAADSSSPILDVLRKALVVATKLSLDDFRSWVNFELNGYPTEKVLPEYRAVRGQLYAQHPYGGNFDVVHFPDTEKGRECADAILTRRISQSIGEIQALLKERNPSSTFEIPLNYGELQQLQRAIGSEANLRMEILPSQLSGIIEKARNTVLDWALRLVSEGILGQGLTFSVEEKLKAATTTTINNYGPNHGIIGPIANSQVQQSPIINYGDLTSLLEAIRNLGIPQEEIDSLEIAISTDPTPQAFDQFGPRIRSWIEKVLRKTTEGTYKVGTDVASKVISEALMVYYGIK